MKDTPEYRISQVEAILNHCNTKDINNNELKFDNGKDIMYLLSMLNKHIGQYDQGKTSILYDAWEIDLVRDIHKKLATYFFNLGKLDVTSIKKRRSINEMLYDQVKKGKAKIRKIRGLA